VISIVGVMIGVMTLNIVLAGHDRLRGGSPRPHPRLQSPHRARLVRRTIANPDEVVQKVRDTPGVAAAAPLVYSQVMLSSGQSVSGVVVRGVPPDMEEAVVDVKAHLTSGSLDGLGAPFEVPVEGTRQDANKDGRPDTTTLTGVILGGELAKQLGLALGDP
jgi:lipoprotein-releasing system permease protein